MKKVVYTNPAPQSSLKGAGNFFSAVSGAFGYVRGLHPKYGTVKVELMNGIMLHSVRVAARGWVNETDANVSGGYDLPPVGSFVFVFFPYGRGNTSGATVLFSVFDNANKKHATRIKEGDEAKIVTVLEGGIRTTYDRETGNYLVEDIDDAKLKILIDKENKKVELFDWNDNKMSFSSSGLKLEGKGNTVSLEAGKTVINGHLEVINP